MKDYLKELAELFFVEIVDEAYDDEETYYELNKELDIQLEEDTLKEKCSLLLAVIERWAEETSVCCSSPKIDDPESTFFYKTPSSCGSCERAQDILDKIFGSRCAFNDLAFVTYYGDRQYSAKMKYLQTYVEQGAEKLEVFMAEEQRKAEEKEREEQRKELEAKNKAAMDKLAGLLEGAEVSEANKEQLLSRLTGEKTSVYGPKVVDKDLVVFWDGRSSWGNSGGIARYSQLHVHYHGKKESEEWNYRDRYDSRNDRDDLQVNGIGEVKVEENGSTITVKVELLGGSRGPRWSSVQFDKVVEEPAAEQATLTGEEQAAFSTFVKSEEKRLLRGLQDMHEHKPEWFDGQVGSYISYRQPSVKETVVKAKIGLAVIITEEQIDARPSNPQIRYNVHIVRAGVDNALFLAEDHAYERTEGCPVISVVDLSSEELVIHTRKGEEKIALNAVNA